MREGDRGRGSVREGEREEVGEEEEREVGMTYMYMYSACLSLFVSFMVYMCFVWGTWLVLGFFLFFRVNLF